VKIAIVNNQAFTLWQFRRGLIRRLMEDGHDVLLITPAGPQSQSYIEQLRGLGARHVALALDQYVDPTGDVRFLFELTKLLRTERIDLVHNITIKANILGTIAAKLAGVRRVVGLVPGLGHVYVDRPGIRAWLVRNVATLLYGIIFRLNYRVWLQNEDNLEFLVRARLLPRKKAVLIRGSGVDLTEYSPECVDPKRLEALREELGITDGRPLVLMAARAHWRKGVREFFTAAELVGREMPALFALAGAAEGTVGVARPEDLEAQESKHFRWLGFRSDVRELIALSDVVTLPSFYPEGVPRSLLEALAIGKPIVTTDSVGCRETVDDGVNGFLVPPQNAGALAAAIATLLRDADLRRRFGARSREKAKREFDERLVVDRVLKEVYGLPLPALPGKSAA